MIYLAFATVILVIGAGFFSEPERELRASIRECKHLERAYERRGKL